MGAYENPALIQDRSGEIFAQGMAAFGAGIAGGINTYTAKMEARRKEAAQEAKQSKQTENAIDLAGIKAFDDWSAQRRKDIPKNAPVIAFENFEAFISESAPGYLDAFKKRALAETAEERNAAQKEIDLFNQNAGKQTQATANLTSGITEVGQLAASPDAVFFEKKDQVAWKMLEKGLAIDGFQDLNITTSRNENGETVLRLNANIQQGENVPAQLEKYGLKPEDYKDNKFSFEMNLNTYRTDSYIAKGFEVKDFKQAGTNTGFLDDQGQIDPSSIKKVTNAQGREIDYYNAAGYIQTITGEIEAQCESWFSGDADDQAQMKATLKKMGYSNKEIKTALVLGSSNADTEGSVADLYRDNILGKIKKTSPGRATRAVIADIEKYNQTVNEDQRMTVPMEGDLYLYSASELAKTTTTTPDKPTEAAIARRTATAEVVAFVDANTTTNVGGTEVFTTTPQSFIDYYLKQGNQSYGTAMTGEKAFDQVLNSKDKNGDPDPQYDKYKNIIANEEAGGRAAALKEFKKDKGIAPNEILILDKSGAIKNRVDIDKKKSMLQALLESQGFSAKDITKVLADFKEQQFVAIKEANPDASDENLRLTLKNLYW